MACTHTGALTERERDTYMYIYIYILYIYIYIYIYSPPPNNPTGFVSPKGIHIFSESCSLFTENWNTITSCSSLSYPRYVLRTDVCSENTKLFTAYYITHACWYNVKNIFRVRFGSGSVNVNLKRYFCFKFKYCAQRYLA